MKRLLLLVICIAAVSDALPQENTTDSLISRLMQYAYAASDFNRTLPQEKVYLHLDNTGYYQGDKIWFQCYVATAGTNKPSQVSRTLHVELLNPGGTIVEKIVLPIAEGRCNGNFTLSQMPFYSGFYEIRAYTKYMLNFGEETIYSRIIPVFDKPEDESDTAEKMMMRPRAANGKYPMKRKMEKREKRVNVRFYPEGGNLVAGIPSRVALEATGADGMPIALSGLVRDKQGNVKAEFATEYGGRGVFEYTPEEGDTAEVTADGKDHDTKLPATLPQGFVMRVDNLSSADSIAIEVRKSAGIPSTTLGAAVICGGALSSYSIIELTDDTPLEFKIGKRRMQAGVARIVLADVDGAIVADRLIFSHAGKRAGIEVAADKPRYEPYDSVRLDLSIRDTDGQPLSAPVSVSVRDGQDEVAYYGNMLTELLLSSEIKGYVHRPSYYFESDDAQHRRALDQLLMVQGWRRYDWSTRAGTEPFELKHMPEQGVEVKGRVLRFGTDKPMTGIQLSSILLKRGEEADSTQMQDNMAHVGTVDVDSTGHFTFTGNLWGKWSLTLSVTNEKNRRKASRILLDRAFSPSPRDYRAADMNVEIAVAASDDDGRKAATETADTTGAWSYYDETDDDETDMTKKIHRIKEVVIKGKKRSREEEIYRNRSTSVAYYDVPSEIDAIRDEGENIREIYELLAAMNDKFVVSRISQGMYDSLSVKYSKSMYDSLTAPRTDSIDVNDRWRITYKGKSPLFVVNHERVWGNIPLYDIIRLSAIKSIYINEDMGIITQYADMTKNNPMDISRQYSCAVFIETYPEGNVPVEAGRGVRKTWIDGYREPDEFYMPDYSVMPKDSDYRRTLYWNPALVPDSTGHASIRFYNNGRCRRMRITAETLAPDGTIGVLNE